MYFFPMLNMYFPIHYSKLLSYMGSANLNFEIPIASEYSDRLKTVSVNEDDLKEMKQDNENFAEIGYENKSILANSGEIVTTLLQGIGSCMLVMGLRGIFVAVFSL